MKKQRLYVTASLTITTVLFLGTAATRPRGQSYVPLTVILQECAFDRAGELRAKQILVVAVRGDGTVLTERAADKEYGLSRTRSIHDRLAAMRTVLNYPTRSKTTYYRLRLRDFRERLLSVYSNLADEGETILGEKVIKVTRENKQTRWDHWLAPGLDYIELRAELVVKDSDGTIAARTVREAVEILRGEPDPSLFEIPDSFVERSPSEVFAEIEKLRGRPDPGCGDKAQRDAHMDRVYEQYKAP